MDSKLHNLSSPTWFSSRNSLKIELNAYKSDFSTEGSSLFVLGLTTIILFMGQFQTPWVHWKVHFNSFSAKYVFIKEVSLGQIYIGIKLVGTLIFV